MRAFVSRSLRKAVVHLTLALKILIAIRASLPPPREVRASGAFRVVAQRRLATSRQTSAPSPRAPR